MQRFFAKEILNNNILLNDNDIHHIKNVMRMKENDKIEVIYNKKLYICSIEDINALIAASVFPFLALPFTTAIFM